MIKDRYIQNIFNADREILWAIANLWGSVGNLGVYFGVLSVTSTTVTDYFDLRQSS